jgi:exodeoxyribonuclease VII small subunit
MADKPKNLDKLSFEQAYQQMEETVRMLESGNLSLDESIKLYAGMALAAHCNQRLDGAELTVKQLTPTGNLVEFDDI